MGAAAIAHIFLKEIREFSNNSETKSLGTRSYYSALLLLYTF